MSERYPGALITKTPVTPAGPQQDGAASGVWTLDQQMQYQKQGVWPTQGTLGPDAYIENLFSTYLYTGTGATQTITNGIDLSGKGGLVWMKSRSAATDHALYDTARGATFDLVSNTTAAQTTQSTGLTAFGTTGFSIGALAKINTNAATYVSWTFREQAKFFDIVTYTGTGANRTIAHNLGSTPGCIIIKAMLDATDWKVYHSGLTSAAYSIQLNLTDAEAYATTVWNSTAPTSSVFSVGTSTDVNTSGRTYVAYLFASNAGGFGAAGADNVISCGSFTTNASGNATVTLGYEPQWVLLKNSTAAAGGNDWYLFDTMRGLLVANPAGNTADQGLYPNLSNAESLIGNIGLTSTGFNQIGWFANQPMIYIAIRRGPMKTPTDATKVFSPISVNNAQGTQQTTGFPVDLQMVRLNAQNSGTNTAFIDRLRGVSTTSTSTSSPYLASSSTSTESTALSNTQAWGNTGFQNSSYYGSIQATFHNISRAPGFFDEVCYTGTGANRTVAHNLGVVPELMIVKKRNAVEDWGVYHVALGNTGSVRLNTTGTFIVQNVVWNDTTPTASVFSVGSNSMVNANADTYVAYVFATCPGVSKVGSYTGTAATQTINCGFTGGARFVMIKRTDSTGDWYVWDTARGMVSGTDPYLLLNSTAAEVNANSVYTATTGFQIVSTAAGINASGGSYIFLAIA